MGFHNFEKDYDDGCTAFLNPELENYAPLRMSSGVIPRPYPRSDKPQYNIDSAPYINHRANEKQLHSQLYADQIDGFGEAGRLITFSFSEETLAIWVLVLVFVFLASQMYLLISIKNILSNQVRER